MEHSLLISLRINYLRGGAPLPLPRAPLSLICGDLLSLLPPICPKFTFTFRKYLFYSTLFTPSDRPINTFDNKQQNNFHDVLIL